MTSQTNAGCCSHEYKYGYNCNNVREITRINSSEFFGSKVGEDLKEFVKEIHKFMEIMGVALVEKEELVAYQLNYVSEVLFNKKNEERVIDVSPLDWEKSKGALLDHFFPIK